MVVYVAWIRDNSMHVNSVEYMSSPWRRFGHFCYYISGSLVSGNLEDRCDHRKFVNWVIPNIVSLESSGTDMVQHCPQIFRVCRYYHICRYVSLFQPSIQQTECTNVNIGVRSSVWVWCVQFWCVKIDRKSAGLTLMRVSCQCLPNCNGNRQNAHHESKHCIKRPFIMKHNTTDRLPATYVPAIETHITLGYILEQLNHLMDVELPELYLSSGLCNLHVFLLSHHGAC